MLMLFSKRIYLASRRSDNTAASPSSLGVFGLFGGIDNPKIRPDQRRIFEVGGRKITNKPDTIIARSTVGELCGFCMNFLSASRAEG